MKSRKPMGPFLSWLAVLIAAPMWMAALYFILLYAAYHLIHENVPYFY